MLFSEIVLLLGFGGRSFGNGDGGVSSSRLTLSRFNVLEIRDEATDGFRRDCLSWMLLAMLPDSEAVALCLAKLGSWISSRVYDSSDRRSACSSVELLGALTCEMVRLVSERVGDCATASSNLSSASDA
jgi:hypothetical protein